MPGEGGVRVSVWVVLVLGGMALKGSEPGGGGRGGCFAGLAGS